MNKAEIKKEASHLLLMINQGIINLPRLKLLLVQLGADEVPTGRKSKMKERIARIEATIK